MSEAKNKYLENPTHYNLLNYVAELEKEKAVLMEYVKSYYHLLSSADTIDFDNDCDFRESEKLFELLKKHGVEI